jgi:hypothetical protein
MALINCVAIMDCCGVGVIQPDRPLVGKNRNRNEIDLVAVNELKKEVTPAEINLNKSRVSPAELKPKLRLLVAYLGYGGSD